MTAPRFHLDLQSLGFDQRSSCLPSFLCLLESQGTPTSKTSSADLAFSSVDFLFCFF